MASPEPPNTSRAQPAISSQVRRLERELGIELLRRTARSVSVTDAGRVFMAHASLALRHIDEARADVAGLLAITAGHVRMGATPVTGGVDLIGALRRFRTRYPGVLVSLRSDSQTGYSTTSSAANSMS